MYVPIIVEKTGVSIVYISYFLKAESCAITLDRHAFRGAYLFDVSLYDDVTELLIQLYGIADAIRVLPDPPKGSITTEFAIELF